MPPQYYRGTCKFLETTWLTGANIKTYMYEISAAFSRWVPVYDTMNASRLQPPSPHRSVQIATQSQPLHQQTLSRGAAVRWLAQQTGELVTCGEKLNNFFNSILKTDRTCLGFDYVSDSSAWLEKRDYNVLWILLQWASLQVLLHGVHGELWAYVSMHL